MQHKKLIEPTNQKEIEKLSVLLVAYNEANSIDSTIRSYYKEINSNNLLEFVVAEDGSTDGTKRILKNLKKEFPLRLITSNKRKGYTKSVNESLAKCKGEWIFFSDSDGQYFPADFWNIWKERNSYDMIIGHKVNRDESAYRLILSRVFHIMSNRLFKLNLKDADCGFRLIRRDIVTPITRRIKHLEYSFWMEFTINACINGYKVKEIAIRHSNRKNDKSRIYTPKKIPKILLKQVIGLLQFYTENKSQINKQKNRNYKNS